MATVDFSLNLLESLSPPSLKPTIKKRPRRATESIASRQQERIPEADVPVHRLAEIRQRQEMSLRSVARHTGISVRTLRKQERSTADIRLSDLRKWQKALDVPMSELLTEPESGLSSPVQKRAQMVRVMKSAKSLLDVCEEQSEQLHAMAENLVSQLIECMPELDGVSAWPTFGQRRGNDELGRAAERNITAESLYGSCR